MVKVLRVQGLERNGGLQNGEKVKTYFKTGPCAQVEVEWQTVFAVLVMFVTQLLRGDFVAPVGFYVKVVSPGTAIYQGSSVG